jgi:RNA polymerase sigma-70 factor (ECF subfamily)
MNSTDKTSEFIRLFSLHTSSLYTYIRILVPNRADAEDVFQETSRTLWGKFDEYEPGVDSNFRAWALRIAQFKALTYRRRELRKRKLFSNEAYVALDQIALMAMESLDLRLDSLGDCYRKLPEEDRRLLTARYRVGQAVEVIASEMGRSAHSIYRALRRVHGALFECVRRFQREERGS